MTNWNDTSPASAGGCSASGERQEAGRERRRWAGGGSGLLGRRGWCAFQLSGFPTFQLSGLSESWQDRPEGWDELERYVTGERGQHEKVCSYRGASGGWWRW